MAVRCIHAPKPNRQKGAPLTTLALAPTLTLLLLLGPVVTGLLGTTLPAFGYLPALGGDHFSLAPWRDLLASPGLGAAVYLSLTTGIAATVLSLGIVSAFCAAWHGTPWFARLLRLLSPLLAVPHVTVAFALAFLIAPSGWLLRLLSPWATGMTRPPDWLTVQDPQGLALIAALVLKEVPFLLLMTLAALNQTERRAQPLARSLGYGPIAAWLSVVLPAVYPQIRLPIFAVLAFSLAVVDVSLVIGPSTPPPLAVRLLQWFNDPDLNRRFAASAGALLQLALVLLSVLGWLLLEKIVAYLGLAWLRRGWRWRHDRWLRLLALMPILLCFGSVLLGLLALLLWSLANGWRFPDALPDGFTLVHWQRYGLDALKPLWHTISLGFGSALLALLLVIACLEHETRYGRRPSNRALWLLYLPLLIPQIAFLFGAQVLLISIRLDGHWLALLWSHLIFVLPYVFLSLADPYRAWDERYARSARCLGASANRVWLRIKLPMLLRPVLIATAVGFAVSVAQYLPTLFAGSGRYPTLTTEAVALAAGGDRRAIGVYAYLQLLLPLLGFALAQAIPAWRFRQRRGLHP